MYGVTITNNLNQNITNNLNQNLEPASKIGGSGYIYNLNLAVPYYSNAGTARLHFKIYGSNMPIHEATISLTIISPPTNNK
jgi:hypothetical protein